MAVASGGTQKIICQVLDHLKIRHLFDAVVTSEMVTNQKPAPDIFLEAARRIGVDPKHCRAYEDTDLGLTAIPWHKDPFWSHVAIATMVNFRWTGYNTLILLAAMQAIPRDYYEAATVDGAGAFRQFTSITLPSLKATLIFVIITSTIGGLQIFDEPRMFDNTGEGGPAQQWLTITLFLYNIGWGEWNFGRAAALAW